MGTVTKKIIYCDVPNIVVRASFMENKCTGVIPVPTNVVDSWEISNPASFQQMVACVDSGTAVITTDKDVAVYDPTIPWTNKKSLYLMNRDDFLRFIQTTKGECKKGMLDNISEYHYEVEASNSIYSAVADAIGAASTESGINTYNTAQDIQNNATQQEAWRPTPPAGDFMNPAMTELVNGRVDLTCEFMANPKSNALRTAQMLNKRCYPMFPSASDKFKIDADNRYPYKIAPAIYHNTPGYCTMHREIERQVDDYEIVPTTQGTINYNFYTLDCDKYEYYPDVLPDVIASESALQQDVNLSGRVKIVVTGLKNMFVEGEEQAKVDMLKRFYSSFLLCTKYFTITSISWSTGFVTALTPNFNQVLLMACVKKKDDRDGLCSFIPIKKNVGLAVAGLTRDEVNELKQIWVNNAEG